MEKSFLIKLILINLFVFSNIAFSKVSLFFVGVKTSNQAILNYFGFLDEYKDYAITHVVFVNDDDKNNVKVISSEPREGVAEWAFQDFKKSYSSSRTIFFEADFKSNDDEKIAEAAYADAKRYLGLPYNKNYNDGFREDSIYCSQLIYKAFKDVTNYDYFKTAVIPETGGVVGIAPVSILKDYKLTYFKISDDKYNYAKYAKIGRK